MKPIEDYIKFFYKKRTFVSGPIERRVDLDLKDRPWRGVEEDAE